MTTVELIYEIGIELAVLDLDLLHRVLVQLLDPSRLESRKSQLLPFIS